MKPDPKKISALKQMNAPMNRQELLSFLGLATYMGTFIQNLSSLTAPLRDLTKKNATFVWTDNHQQAFEHIKDSVTTEVTLTYFHPHKHITVQVDASMKGLGAALLQDGRPIAFASKSLTETESRYANIEREMLAVVYGSIRSFSAKISLWNRTTSH